MSGQERFADPGEGLWDIATHFVVHCPNCRGKALVNPYEDSWRLTCTACFHVERPGRWYGSMTAYVSVKCRECHQQLTRSATVDGQWKKLKMKCENCGDECEYEAHISRHPKHNGLMTDPVFGLELWLQKRMGDDVLWAFHDEHLSLLEQFVSARHRERGITPRNTIRKNSSMISRLPSFIRRAGNREEVLKVIRELQVKTL